MNELIIDISEVIFGITALILISRARNRLTDGSLKRYISSFSVCLSFVVLFSLWSMFRNIFSNIDQVNHSMILAPELLFIIALYIAFIFATYRVVHISHEFGFQKEGSEIDKELAKKYKKVKKK